MYVTKKGLQKMSEYNKYVHYCDAYGIKPDSKKVYEVSQREAKRRGKDISPAEYARRQAHDDLSDKEVYARYLVARGTDEQMGKEPLTFGQFLKDKRWREVDERSSQIYKEEKANWFAFYKNQGFSDAVAMKYAIDRAKRVVSYQVYGSEI